jgi:hypothetical protein
MYRQKFPSLILAIAIVCVASLAAAAQNTSMAGKYEGTAKSPDGEVALKLDLAEDAGKYSGQITSPHGVYKIVNAKLTDGVLALDAVGDKSKGKLTLRRKGDILTGEFTADGRTGSVEFKKVAVDEISGDWDGVADAQGQPFPFTLSLKLDGEKVTGSSTSQLGTASISTGSWKDGKLAFVLEGGSGQIVMAATMVDGKLSGDYDFAGQSSGKWVAIKKK